MKRAFALSLILLSASAAFGSDTRPNHACDQAALEIVQNIFGPTRTAVARTAGAWLRAGGMGAHEEITVSLKGSVRGYLVMSTMSPEEHAGAECEAIRLSIGIR